MIRDAAKGDAKAMVEIHYQAVHAIPPKFYSSRLLSSWSPEPTDERIEWLSRVIEDRSKKVLLDDNSGDIRGFSIYDKRSRFLLALYVDHTCTGEGVGTELLSCIEAFAGVGEVSVKASLNSRGFYEKNGFKEQGLSYQELSDGSKIESIRMTKYLSDEPL